jgi:PASTA domain
MGAVVRRETEPRDASDFMMDTIAGHFALGNSPPQPLQARRHRHWAIRTLLVCAVGLLIAAAAAAHVRSPIIVLPDCTGTDETLATNALRDAGLIVAMRHQSSTMVRAHHLIGQSPPAGQWVRRGATVVLTTSTGIPHRARSRSLAATAAPVRPHAVLPHAVSPHAVSPREIHPRVTVAHTTPHRAAAHAAAAPRTVVAVAPPPIATAVAATPVPAQCPPRSWLQRTLRHVFGARTSGCH